jgi:hypothetical protein
LDTGSPQGPRLGAPGSPQFAAFQQAWLKKKKRIKRVHFLFPQAKGIFSIKGTTTNIGPATIAIKPKT